MEAPGPTLEDKEKIRHWLESGITLDRIDFLQSMMETQWRYLQVLKHQLQHDNDSNNMTNNQNRDASFYFDQPTNDERKPRGKFIKSMSGDLIVPVTNQKNRQRKIIKPVGLKQIHKTNNKKRSQSQIRNSANAKNNAKIYMHTRSKLQSKNQTEPNADSVKEKKVNLSGRSCSSKFNSKAIIRNGIKAGPNCEQTLQIVPTTVYVNPTLCKIKIETDYVPIIKAELGVDVDEEAVAAMDFLKSTSNENSAAAIARKEFDIIKIEPPDSIFESTSNKVSNFSQDRALRTKKILRAIFHHVSTKDLLYSCSLVNKRWNKISRLLLQQDRAVYAHIDQISACQDLNILNQLIETSSIRHPNLKVPYSGLRFVEKNGNRNKLNVHFHDKNSLKSTSEDIIEFPAILSAVKFKRLHLTGAVLNTSNQHCPAFKLLAKILQAQSSNLELLTLEPFFCTAEQDLNENSLFAYEAFVRKFMCAYFPAITNNNQGFGNVKQVEVNEKNEYDSRNIYWEILRNQVEDLLEYLPNLEVINGFISINLLQVVLACKKIHCVKNLKVFLHCDSMENEFEALSKLTCVEQAILNELQIENMEIGRFFSFDAFPHLFAISNHVTLNLIKNCCANLKSLSITHRDFITIFDRKTVSNFSHSIPTLLHLSILNYDFGLDPAGTSIVCACDLKQIFPEMKRIVFDLKNPPSSPAFKCLRDKIFYKISKLDSFLFKPCPSVDDVCVNAWSEEERGKWGRNENVRRKIVAGFIKSFPNVRLFVYNEQNLNLEELKDLMKMVLSSGGWEYLQIIRFVNVALWEVTGNFDSWIEIILDRNNLLGRHLMRLEIEVGRHCQGACANGELFWNQGQELVSKKLATLVASRIPLFSVEIDLGHWKDGDCFYTLPNLPEFFKCVTSFQNSV